MEVHDVPQWVDGFGFPVAEQFAHLHCGQRVTVDRLATWGAGPSWGGPIDVELVAVADDPDFAGGRKMRIRRLSDGAEYPTTKFVRGRSVPGDGFITVVFVVGTNG